MGKVQIKKRYIFSITAFCFGWLFFIVGIIMPMRVVAESKQEKIDKIEEKIEAIEDKINVEQKKERKISDEITTIDTRVDVINLQIEKTQEVVEDLDSQIKEKAERVEILNQDLKKQKELLAEYLRSIDETYGEQQLFLMENGGNWDDFFQTVDTLEKIQDDLRKVYEQVEGVKNEILTEQEALQETRGEHNQVVLMQEDQRVTLESEQNRKEKLLAMTQKGITTLTETKEDLRTQLNALQSLGTAINLEEAIETAEYASSKTGVRAAYLLGVLRVESNLGQNVGGGRYKTDMNPSQHATFEKICKDLGLKAKDMPVSKRVCYNKKSKDGCGGWGGAMGPAQFMPSTWIGYKDKVAKVTGHNPPNPWNLKDAMVAMGLKLSAVSGVTAGKASAERQAAAMYLAGGAWKSYSWYGDRVMYYADGFEKYMKD